MEKLRSVALAARASGGWIADLSVARIGVTRWLAWAPLRKRSAFVAGNDVRSRRGAAHDQLRMSGRRRLFWPFVLLKEFEIVDRSLGIGPAKSESRHVRMNSGQAVLQALSEIIVVELAVSKGAKWRGIDVWAAACLAHGVTPSAQGFEHGLASLLLGIEGMTGLARAAHHQEEKTKNLHGCSR
jgi:hypothetical protein